MTAFAILVSSMIIGVLLWDIKDELARIASALETNKEPD